MQSRPTRRQLPPGIEDDVVFGILWVRVGLFKAIKPTTTAHKVFIQFWGESTPALLYTSQANPIPQEYDVKCPITFFEKYLQDMKKNLKIEVENMGYVQLDLSKYLKKNITLTDKSPFSQFKGFFEVVGKNNKKVGSLELELCANFNPEIALRELSQEEKAEVCPASNIKQCQCRGDCQCNPDKINALDVIAVEKPELFREFYEEYKQRTSPVSKPKHEPIIDQRIPNSLNNMPNRGVFDPNRYSQPEGSTPKIGQNFPTVEKILTYSNLKLKKEEEVKESKEAKESSRPVSIKQHLPRNSEPQSQNLLKPSPPMSRMDIQREEKEKPAVVFNEITRKSSQKQIKRRQEQLQIEPVLQIEKAEPNLSEVSEVQRMDESVSVQAQRQILSRVVNLNAQLEKEKEKISPKKSKDQEKPVSSPYQPLPNYITSPPPNLTLNRTRPEQRKGSSLLLNLVIQLNVNSVSLPSGGKFILSYRPYGQRDNIKNGPQLPSNFMMMFPVGQPQIAKMNKIPFILQFWSASDGQLLGVIKLSLTKIQKGFIFDGRLNELAIKTSLLPTVIHKGSHSIVSLIDKPVGQCYLSAHIGTAAQIQTYLNTPKQNVNEPIRPSQAMKEEIIPVIKQNQVKRKQGSFQDFTNLLQLIDSNTKDSFVQHLINFMKNKEATQQQFNKFLNDLEFNGGDIFHLLSKGDTMNCKDLSECFDDYRQIKEKYADFASSILKELTLNQTIQITQKIQEKSNFGIISKADLAQILKGNKIAKLTQLLGDIAESTKLIQWIKSKGKYPYRKFAVRETTSQQFIEQMLIEESPHFMQAIENVLMGNNSALPLSKIRAFFIRKSEQQFSLWFWYQLSSIVYRKFQEDQKDKGTINTSLLYNWLVLKVKQIGRDQREEPLKRQIFKEQKQIPEANEKHQPLVPEQNLLKPEPIKPVSPPPENASAFNQTNKENKSINNSLPKEKPEASKEEQKLTEHKFVISLEQLQLEQDLSGECTIFYHFPYEEEQISSRKIQLLRDKYKYRLTCSGTHKFTIQQSIEKYLGESTLSIRVVLGKEGELYGDLHSEQLITKGNQFRVIPLFSVNRDGMVGKIKLQIEYLAQLAQQHLLGRQTIKDVFLPKNGYLNFELSSTVDQNRLRQQYNLKEQFYIQISLDMFGENGSLAPHFPPFHSKLYSDLSSELSISGSYKISLTPQLLQHLRAGSCQARMSLVYYAKEKGNYERKDMLVASFKAPLFAVIREEGLKGDYAFKNKLGMFVSLAHCTAKYQKTAKTMADVAGKAGDASRESFWLLIDFSQIINFQGDLGWLKFEIVTKGKRFATDKTLIREEGSYPLDGRCLCLQMGQEQFSITKILAVSVIIGSERYGMDINLRPVAKLLGRQKFTVQSQYFIVVDDQSRSRKIRVGAKLYAFRGQASLGPFVQALSKNCIRSELVGDEKEDTYQEDIQSLRKNLKMSGKAFDESLGQLLDKRKKERLPKGFFISRIQSSLDLSPILSFNQSDIYLLAEQLASEISQRDLLEYIEQSGLKLVNLRSQFLERYSFSKLNQLHLDQNVEYLGLSKEIDLLVFAHKIRIQELQQPQPIEAKGNQHKMIRVSIIRGYNFNLLYNGIMPNARVAIPEIGLQTEVVERSSQPVFNEHLNLQIPSQLKKLRVEVYHEISDDTDAILIGQGTASISEVTNSSQIPFSKVFRVVLSSLMSNRMQAALDIKIELTNSRQEQQERSYSEMDESIGDSRVEEAMQRIHKLTDFKKRVALFESSDED